MRATASNQRTAPRIRSLAALVALLVGGVACSNTSDGAASDTGAAPPTVAAVESTPALDTPVESGPPTAPAPVDVGEVAIELAFAWPPLFAVPGSDLPVEVVVVRGPLPDTVDFEISPVAEPTAAAFDVSTQRWTATIQVPAELTAPSITVNATATIGGATSAAVSATVPVAASAEVIEPDVVEVEPSVALTLGFGDGPDQVGLDVPESEGELSIPNSVQIDPLTGNFVILDSVNRRLTVATPRGDVVDQIALAGDGLLDDLVVLGSTGRALVSQFRGAGGQLEVGAFLVDLEAGTVTFDGPLVIAPPTPPVGTELIWSEALGAVFGRVYDPSTDRVGYYRLFDTASEELDVSVVPEFWWNIRVEQDRAAVGIEYNDLTIFTQLPHGFVGVSNVIVLPDDSILWSAGSVDPDAEPDARVHYYLGRTNIACGASIIAEIDFSAQSELGTRSMIADDSGVYVVDIGVDYRLLRYELPSPTCA